MNVQKNFITKQAYTKGNQIDLLTIKDTCGYISDYWVTFLQAKGMGLNIKKGESGVKLGRVIGGAVEDKDGNTVLPADSVKSFKKFVVFNLDQTDYREQEEVSGLPIEMREYKEIEDRPEYGRVYALTGDDNTPSIMRGDSWAESEVRE